MSVNTAITLNRIFSNPAWKLLLVAGLLAFIACFSIKGKKEQYRSLSVSCQCVYILSRQGLAEVRII